MTRSRWIVFAVIIVGVFGFLLFNKKSDNTTKVDSIDPAKVIGADQAMPDHVFGSPAKKTVLIEYGDFQCPACGNLFPELKPIKDHYKAQLTFVFRDFPLTSIHPNALAAATAAEDAGLQAKFYEMHDQLYEHQNDWAQLNSDERTKKFVQYAKAIGLDTAKFESDLSSPKIADKIRRDQALGKKINATSTPTLVLDGKTLPIDKWNTPKNLENTIRDAIKKSGQTLPKPLNKN